ncbi:MAG: NAD-dependent succinate-semialdehyde dehydrogenase [Oceanospirillaceae bacterium]|nr:NAD-dependent succinate-semialdehyde dehydrogenase [Oceanospirillaceae bacterium]
MIEIMQKNLLKTQAFVNGQWVDADNGKTFDVYNPATGEKIASCADLSADEAQHAIERSNSAFVKWRKTTAKHRASLLRKWYELVMENQEDLAQILTAEQGKALLESRGEIAYGASYIEWFAEEAKRSYGDVLPTVSDDRRLLTIKQPVGVVSAITPWNFPTAMITRKASPALAAGCTIVIKPAAETPLSALALAELARQAGIPDGVINVITSTNSREVGLELTTNPLVKKVTFTGSTPVGKILLTQAAQTVKKVSMELGGNAPVLVFEDADLEQAANGALFAKFRNCGQTCTCANRIIVHENVYDEFVGIFTAKVKALKQGNGVEDGVEIGPLINEKAVNDVNALMEDACDQGATAIITHQLDDTLKGSFYPPTILTNVSPKARVFREEIFGPVAPIFKFSSDEEGIALANDTEYGLASYIYTKDYTRIWRVSEELEYGMVGINETSIAADVIPFGGVKESGLGREGSKYGLDDFTEMKYLCMGGM